MKKLFVLFVLFFMAMDIACAQTKATPKTDSTKVKATADTGKTDTSKHRELLNLKPDKFGKIDSADAKLNNGFIKRFGKIDTADLKLTVCDFEKDANAMVLFDRAVMICSGEIISIVRQKRIKIFNDKGKSEANIRIEFNNKFGKEHILAIEAETINLSNGKIEVTKVDPKLMYLEHTDKEKDAIVLSLPNVKAGSIIEYRYAWERDFSRNIPKWDFQSSLPTRYSQINVLINPYLSLSAFYRKTQPFTEDSVSVSGFGHVWGLENVPSSKDEPFMRSAFDALQSISLIISAVTVQGQTKAISSSWTLIGRQIANEKLFYKPYEQNINDDAGIVAGAKALITNDEKIAFIFNHLKTLMKWNEDKSWFSKDGIKSAWKKKSGNWGEINMILCHYLKQAGINAYPMLVSTRDNGMIITNFPDVYQVNKIVTYIPVDSTRRYVLDATDKYNIYNEIPYELLNSYGLYLDKEKDKYDLVFMKKDISVKQIVFINANIKPDGTMKGTAQINSYSYNKSNSWELYKRLDEKEYKDYLRDNDNNLTITSLKFENAEIDSLPLTQSIEFKLDLPGTDDKYIYFNPNLFTSLHNNPFINQTRVSDIDFGCSNIYSIGGRYKIPDGYKVESLPKNMNLLIGDKSIGFKRMVAEEEGYIAIYYVINYKRSTFSQEEYPDIHVYFKKMHEILNEQIVLKKL